MTMVSVIVPCFNLGRYLDEAVDSVLAQTFTDFEILVVDDGSTEEETTRLLTDYRKPRTRVVRSENRGLPAAKNLGLANTSGAYICMLDADDRLDPLFLEKSVAALDEDSHIAFVSHWLRTFGDEIKDWTPESCELPVLLDLNTVNGAALVRRTALDAVGGFDETMRTGCEDWDMWISLTERGLKGRILPEVLFYYRRRAESMSRVMMRGDGHPGLYRYIASKHKRAYADHLDALLSRREEDISNLRRHTHDLELEYYGWLGPELTKWRDDVASLERKAAIQVRTAMLEDAGRAYETARRRVHELDAEANRAREEAAELRASLSWRMTAPLRFVYEQVRRLRRGRQ